MWPVSLEEDKRHRTEARGEGCVRSESEVRMMLLRSRCSKDLQEPPGERPGTDNPPTPSRSPASERTSPADTLTLDFSL